ncbi:MAG: hypothetical protein ACRC0G_07915 [Fusobacteriaceae bacterium]
MVRSIMVGPDLVKVYTDETESVKIRTSSGITRKNIVISEIWHYGVNSVHYENGGNEDEYRYTREYLNLKNMKKIGDTYISPEVYVEDVGGEFYEKFIEDLKKSAIDRDNGDWWYSIDEDSEPYSEMSGSELEKFRVYGDPEYKLDGDVHCQYYFDIQKILKYMQNLQFIRIAGEHHYVVNGSQDIQKFNPNRLDSKYILDELMGHEIF